MVITRKNIIEQITLSILGMISPLFETMTFEPIFKLSSLTKPGLAKLALLTVVPAINTGSIIPMGV